MKLMDITPYYHPTSGGIKTYINYKVEFMKNQDVEHVVVIPGKKPRTYTVGRTRFYELSSFGLIGGYRFFSSVKEINRIIEEEKPDVVELGGTYLLVPFLKRKNYLLSVFYHADAKREIELMPMPSPFKKMLLNHVFEKCLKKADLLLVPTEKYKREFDALGFENVYYTPMGVDTELFNPSKRDFYLKKLLGVEEKKFLLLYAGRLSVEKGIKTLLQTFELLDPSLFHLVVVGKGPLSFLVKWYAKRFNNLTYIPYLEKRELSVLYASADLFVSASPFETFGFSFLEAQASGTPVCAFDLELETQILKEFLSKERTPQALAQAIVKGTDLVSKSTRLYLRQRVEEDFSIFKNLERIISLYYSKTFARMYC